MAENCYLYRLYKPTMYNVQWNVFVLWISNEILNDINTMSCPIKVNSDTIELTVHTSCCCVEDLLYVKSNEIKATKKALPKSLMK